MKCIVLLMITFSLNAIASGDRVGNGGDVVKCKGSSEILDFYEATLELKEFKNESYKVIVDQVVDNLTRLNPLQAGQYRQRLKSFYDSIEFKSGVSLVDIKDSKHTYLPKSDDCQLLQIAIRKNFTSKASKQFVIDEDLWKSLSEKNKAGLVVHEIVYEHFYKLGEEDSLKARVLNSYMFSNKAFKDSSNDYWDLVKSLKVPVYK